MRRFAQYGGSRINLVVTPDMVLDIRNAAKTLVTQVHIGREFQQGDGVPRLGPPVPQWVGETVGFWDGETLVTWTSNIQAWINRGSAEFSSSLQSIEFYSPLKAADGTLTGLRHEAVLYDAESLVDPVRIVQTLQRLGRLNENAPLPVLECVPHIYPIEGAATPVTPGMRFEYEVPDIYGRPWAQLWERYREQGMQRPAERDIFSFGEEGSPGDGAAVSSPPGPPAAR